MFQYGWRGECHQNDSLADGYPEGNGGEEGSFGANGKHVEWNSPLLADDHFLNVRVHAHIAAGEPPSVGR